MNILQTPQAVRNRAKHAENRQRELDGLPALNRRHGQPMKTHARANVVRRTVNGVLVFDSNVRSAGYKRTFVGRFATKPEADAAAAYFLATGERPVRARQQPKPRERRGDAPRPEKAEPAPRSAPHAAKAARLAMIRRVFNERMAA